MSVSANSIAAVARVNGVALHAPGQTIAPATLRQRACTELLRQAAYLAPAEARYRSGLGLLLSRNREWIHDAVQEVEEAIRLEPANASHRGLLAEMLLGQGLRLRARKAAEAAIALDPHEKRARRVLADTVDDPAAVDDELRDLFAAVAPPKN